MKNSSECINGCRTFCINYLVSKKKAGCKGAMPSLAEEGCRETEQRRKPGCAPKKITQAPYLPVYVYHMLHDKTELEDAIAECLSKKRSVRSGTTQLGVHRNMHTSAMER